MKNYKWHLPALLLLCFLSSCIVEVNTDDDDDFQGCTSGRNETVTQVLDLNTFDGIKLKIDADVFINQGDEQRVEVEAQQNIIDLIETDVQGRTWEIEFDDCVRQHNSIKIYITIPSIDLITISGSGFVRGENTFTVEDIDLRINGSGDIDLALEADEVDGEITGSGKIILEGSTREFDLSIAGSGDYSTFDLDAQRGDIKITGSGDAEVYVAEFLDIRISGSGDVFYKGFPNLNVEINGSGRVVDAN